MALSIADQITLDDALVAPADRLKIGKCNLRLSSDVTSKEATLQVVYDVLKLTPFYKAFQVTADAPEIYMQEFWASAYVHNRSVRFKMNKKKHIIGLGAIRGPAFFKFALKSQYSSCGQSRLSKLKSVVVCTTRRYRFDYAYLCGRLIFRLRTKVLEGKGSAMDYPRSPRKELLEKENRSNAELERLSLRADLTDGSGADEEWCCHQGIPAALFRSEGKNDIMRTTQGAEDDEMMEQIIHMDEEDSDNITLKEECCKRKVDEPSWSQSFLLHESNRPPQHRICSHSNITTTNLTRQLYKLLATNLPNFASLFGFDYRLKALEDNFRILRPTNQYAAGLRRYEADKILLDYNMADTVTIKDIEMGGDDEEPSAGTDRGSKRRRSGKEPLSTSAPIGDAIALYDVFKGLQNREFETGVQDGTSRDEFKEGDFHRLRIQDIEDMLLLLVQGKVTNLSVEERIAFNVSLRMFTRRVVIQRRVEDLQLGVESYQKKLNLKMLILYTPIQEDSSTRIKTRRTD
ncbi:hypothetical protein Tco_1524201 [Tanacetum coccineum]